MWTPALIFLAVIALGLANLPAAGLPGSYAGVLLVIGTIVLLWAMNALVIASFFNFRARDATRLAAHYLVRLPLVTLGTASLLVLAGGVVLVTFDAVLALLGGVWAGLLLRNARPLVADVQSRFIAR